jgi:hypothetical protein
MLVLDLGHASFRVLPFLHGTFFREGARQFKHLSGAFLAKRLGMDLRLDRQGEALVGANFPGDGQSKSREPLFWGTCFSAGMPSQTLMLQPASMHMEAEFLFGPRLYAGDDEGSLVSIQEAVVEAVEACGVEAMRPLLGCVVLAGALCGVDGFKTRLQHELRLIFHDRKSKNPCPLIVFSVAEPQYAAWRGLAMLPPEQVVHKDLYLLEQAQLKQAAKLKQTQELYKRPAKASASKMIDVNKEIVFAAVKLDARGPNHSINPLHRHSTDHSDNDKKRNNNTMNKNGSPAASSPRRGGLRILPDLAQLRSVDSLKGKAPADDSDSAPSDVQPSGRRAVSVGRLSLAQTQPFGGPQGRAME